MTDESVSGMMRTAHKNPITTTCLVKEYLAAGLRRRSQLSNGNSNHPRLLASKIAGLSAKRGGETQRGRRREGREK